MVISRLRLAIGEFLVHGPTRASIAAASVFAALLIVPGLASAATKPVDLRVVNTAGRALAEFRQYTGTVDIKTDRNADCFGQGSGGSGDRVKVPGSTALGAVRDGLAFDHALRPLSVTDAFADQGLGLGVCGIGGFKASGSSFWYLKADHAGSQVSGSQLEVKAGEPILWYLTPTFPPPAELVLSGPASARPGVPFGVTVSSYADDGTRTAAAGATVTGAAAPTDAGGHAMVTITGTGTHTLRATRSPDIPSNGVEVCVNPDRSQCPHAHGKLIFGTAHRDRIAGTRGWDRIKSGAGRDVVDLRSGGEDRVSCGGGRDRVIERRRDHDNRIAASCERVIRR